MAPDHNVNPFPRWVGAVLVGGAVVFAVGVVFLVRGQDGTGAPFIIIGGVFLALGLRVYGAIPPYLAARPLGLSFSDVFASPFRGFSGVGYVRAFRRYKAAGGDAEFSQFGMAGLAGADLHALAKATEIRVRSGHAPDFHALSAASIAGHDPVSLASDDDVVRGMVSAEESRRAV